MPEAASALSIASSSSCLLNAPSILVEILPSASITNSHGSDGRLNVCTCSRGPLFGSLSV